MPAAAGEVDVEQHDVGRRRPDHRDAVLDDGRLADDLDARRPAVDERRIGQLGSHTGAEQGVVLDEDDADRH